MKHHIKWRLSQINLLGTAHICAYLTRLPETSANLFANTFTKILKFVFSRVMERNFSHISIVSILFQQSYYAPANNTRNSILLPVTVDICQGAAKEFCHKNRICRTDHPIYNLCNHSSPPVFQRLHLGFRRISHLSLRAMIDPQGMKQNSQLSLKRHPPQTVTLLESRTHLHRTE